eukprot:2272267-Amphidinium_carterae.1
MVHAGRSVVDPNTIRSGSYKAVRFDSGCVCYTYVLSHKRLWLSQKALAANAKSPKLQPRRQSARRH